MSRVCGRGICENEPEPGSMLCAECHAVVDLRVAYVGSIARLQEGDVVDEIERFLVDMMDHCEQTGIAEPAIVAAHDALKAKRSC